jgi:hypothetical protein
VPREGLPQRLEFGAAGQGLVVERGGIEVGRRSVASSFRLPKCRRGGFDGALQAP